MRAARESVPRLACQVVDEAVFALAEKQPGFAKVFFYLEQEVMKPRHEIHSIGMPEIVEPVEESKVEQRDRAARALFSATEIVSATSLKRNSADRAADKVCGVCQALSSSVPSAGATGFAKFSRAYGRDSGQNDMARMIAKMTADGAAELRDAWGTNLRIEPGQHISNKVLHSAQRGTRQEIRHCR